MKHLLTLALALSITSFSCSVKKKVTTEKSFVNDNTKIVQDNVRSIKQDIQYYSIKKDTTITVPIRSVIDTVSYTDKFYDKAGKELPITKTKRGSGVSVHTTVLPSGQLVVNAMCDSITTLLPGFIEMYRIKKSEVDSLKQLIVDLKSTNTQETKEENKSSGLHWGFYLGLIILFLLGVMYYIIKKSL